MKKKDISRVLQRYLSGHQEGKDAYFDADEIDELLDSFEESDDYTYYDEVLALGLRLHPGNPDLQVKQCKSYVYNEDYDSALVLIESIAETDNQDLDMLRLECYVMQDSYDKVIEHIEKLIADKCEYLETIFEYIAPILGDVEMTKEAHDFINRGLMLFPDNLILKDELCYNLEMEGDIKKAIEVCNELIDKNPYSNDYWFTLGRLYSISEDYEKAIEAFDFALTCDDSNEELKILKGHCLYMNGNHEKALEVYNDVKKADETYTPRLMPLLAECYVKLEDYEKAYVLLKELLKQKNLHEVSSGSYISYILCCVETGHKEEASDTLMKAAKLFPYNIRILSMLVLAHMENGDEHKAQEATDLLFMAFEEMENKQLDDFKNLYRTGQYFFMKGNIDEALQYFNKVLNAVPGMPYIHLHIAMAYLAKGDIEHFCEHYKKTSPEELFDYLKKVGFDLDGIIDHFGFKHIPPEDLVKEFLKNKDNNN